MLIPFLVKIVNIILRHFGKNFVRKNFLEKMFEFSGILTKKGDF